MKERASRGRLSSIDTLPEWADEAKMNACAALKDNRLSQLDILDRFNAELQVAAAANGVTDPPVISKSAFSRKALRLAAIGRRLQDTREITNALAPRFEQLGDERLALALVETVKSLTFEMLENAGELPANSDTAEMLLNAARTVKSAEDTKRVSGETRRRADAELEKLNKLAAGRVDAIAKEAGLSSDQIARIRRDVLGVRT